MNNNLEEKSKEGFLKKIKIFIRNVDHYMLDCFLGVNHGYKHEKISRDNLISHSYISPESIEEIRSAINYKCKG